MNVIEFFAMRQWDYQQDNLIGMWDSLSEKDKDVFFFDMRQLDWDLFLQHYFRGIRQYLLRDPLETIPEALVRWNRWVEKNYLIEIWSSVGLKNREYSMQCWLD